MDDVCINVSDLEIDNIAEMNKAVKSFQAYKARQYNKLSFLVVTYPQRLMIYSESEHQDVDHNEDTYLNLKMAVVR